LPTRSIPPARPSARRKFVDGAYVGSYPVRWNVGGTVATELEVLSVNPGGFGNGVAIAINDAGTIVGKSYKYISSGPVVSRALRWDAGGNAATELGDIGTGPNGKTEISAFAINAAGVIVGRGQKFLNGIFLGDRAVLWEAGSTVAIELGDIGASSSGYTFCEALGVDAAGNVFGYGNKYAADGTFLGFRPIRWDAGSTAATELDDLLDTERYGHSYPVATNSFGTIIGTAVKYVGGALVGSRAVRWDAGGVAVTELGSLGSDSAAITHSIASDLNDSGIAVGHAGARAVFWGTDAIAVDLNTLLSPNDASLWSLRYGYGISDTNWITGVGTFDPRRRGWPTGELRSTVPDADPRTRAHRSANVGDDYFYRRHTTYQKTICMNQHKWALSYCCVAQKNLIGVGHGSGWLDLNYFPVPIDS
jgi:hypothetical protein